jgi:hypothetical protein
LIENLVDIELKLSDEIRILRKDNENLNFKLGNISAAECHCCASPNPGATCHEAPPSAAPETRRIKSERDVLTTGSTSLLSPAANPGNPGGVHMTFAKNFFGSPGWDCDEGFTTIVKKKGNKSGDLPISGIHKRGPAVFWVTNSSCLPLISKKPKLKSLFISRLGPDVAASDVENVLQGHLNLPSLTCTKLKTKFNSCLSFNNAL